MGKARTDCATSRSKRHVRTCSTCDLSFNAWAQIHRPLPHRNESLLAFELLVGETNRVSYQLLSAYVCDCKQNLFGQSCPSYPWQSLALGAMVFSERARRCEATEALAPFWGHLSHQWGKGFVLVKEWHRALSQLVHELIQYASSTDNMPGPAPALESQWELIWNMMTRKWRWKLMLFFWWEPVNTGIDHFFKLYWCSETELYEQQARTVSDVSLLNMYLGQELTPFLHPFFSFYPVMKG